MSWRRWSLKELKERTTGRTGSRGDGQEVPGQHLGSRLGSAFVNAAVNDLGRSSAVLWGVARTAASREELSGAWLGELAKTRLRGVQVMLTSTGTGKCPLLRRSMVQGREP